jgi:hypothetical protein
MSKEKFIQGKIDTCHHEGRRSTVRRLDASNDRLRERYDTYSGLDLCRDVYIAPKKNERHRTNKT